MSTIIFTQPHLVNAALADKCGKRVVVLDIAFDSRTPERTTFPFIKKLTEENRLLLWLDHHDHQAWKEYQDDPRFVLVPRARCAPACPPLITPEIYKQFPDADTIVCHGDFDGVMSAVKYCWQGEVPFDAGYYELDEDSIAADSRVGTLSKLGTYYEKALKADPRDDQVRYAIVDSYYCRGGDREDYSKAGFILTNAVKKYEAVQQETELLKKYWTILDNGRIAYSDLVEIAMNPFDMTALLLNGQQRASVAVIRSANEEGRIVYNLAGPADRWNLRDLFGLKGGMPNRITIFEAEMQEQAILQRLREA